MRQQFFHYLIVLAVFLTIDAVWLSTLGRKIYVAEIGELLRDKPNFTVAFIFYLLYALGLLIFVVQPALQHGSLGQAAVMGAFFGLVAYATYDMTNLATIKGFTARMAVIDMAWGATLSAAVTAISIVLIRSLKLT